MLISVCRPFPPLLWAFGLRPSYVANGRPDWNNVSSGTAAAIALAVIGPMPGVVANRRRTSLARCHSRMRAYSRSLSSPSRRS